MFDELCRTGRTHELATIHRFRQSWERDASLLLRAANPDALETYIAHARVTPGTFDDLVTDAARTLIQHSSEGRTVAMTAETNDHVAALNAAIQQQRRQRGDLGQHAARVAAGETASVGDVVATRRNDRTLHTDQGEPVRNRDRWTVIGAHPDGSLTVSHLHGHGTAILPAEYVRNHVRLGYAATAYGHQGDTVDVSLTLITEATSHRSLYVGATRGRHDNQILVVADPDQARDVLEHVLTNDRADVPALVQRRNLARQLPRPHDPERAVTTARHALEHAIRRAEPFTRPLHQAEAEVERTTAAVRQMRAAIAQTPRWRRIGLTAQLHEAEHCLADKFAGLDAAQRAAEPYIALVDRAETELHKAELVERQTRINDRMDRLSMDPPSRTLERDGPGRSFGIDL